MTSKSTISQKDWKKQHPNPSKPSDELPSMLKIASSISYEVGFFVRKTLSA